MKILVIRFSSIGDIVLTTPIIRCLKFQINPTPEIYYLTKESYKFLLIKNPNITEVLSLKPELWQTIQEIKRLKFDYIIDLQKNLRSSFIRLLVNSQTYSFNKLNIKKFLLTTFKINILPSIHIVDRYFYGIRKLGIENDGKGLDYFYAADKNVIESKIGQSLPNHFVAMAIGGQHYTKKMPYKKMEEIVYKINEKVVILGGIEDFDIGHQLFLTFPQKVINLCGQLNLDESAGVTFLSNVLVTHDTGMMHIAAALKKPIITIWGNTVPLFGMSPYYGNDKVSYAGFEVMHLGCRPCSKLGFEKCPKNHFNCMNLQDAAKISASINSI